MVLAMLYIQTKGALITCINHCHLLELTLLCLVDLWKLDESISNFKGVWCIYFYFTSYRNTCICMQRVKILIIRRVLRHLIWACTVFYVHFYRTLCTSRPWSYYFTFMSMLSNIREILQFHFYNVALYTEKETISQGQNRAHFFFFFFSFLFYIYFLFF